MKTLILLLGVFCSHSAFSAQNETAKCYLAAEQIVGINAYSLCSMTQNAKIRLDCYQSTIDELKKGFTLNDKPEGVALGLCNSDSKSEQVRAFNCFSELKKHVLQQPGDTFISNYVCAAGGI